MKASFNSFDSIRASYMLGKAGIRLRCARTLYSTASLFLGVVAVGQTNRYDWELVAGPAEVRQNAGHALYNVG